MSKSKHEEEAEDILRELGKADALYTHYGEVCARPEAYSIQKGGRR